MSHFVNLIVDRLLNRNKNLICIFIGPTGSGKSYSSIRLGEVVSERTNSPFNIDNVIFSTKELIELIENNRLKKGSAVVYEEVGVEADARNFYKEENKQLSYILETFRTMNICLIMNVPNKSMADKKIRLLSHVNVEMKHINHHDKTAWGEVRFNQYNALKDKIYQKHQVVRDEEGVVRIIKTKFKLANKQLLELYEKKRSAFLNQVIEKAKQTVSVEDDIKEFKSGAGKDKKYTVPEIMEMKEHVYQILKDKYMLNGRLPSRNVISVEYGVGYRDSEKIAYIVKKRLKKEVKPL
jgi:hypothetical protein